MGSASSYSRLQKSLHWLSAVIIVWALVSGTYLAVAAVSPAVRASVAAFNVSLTTVFIPFFILRLYISVIQSFVERRAARSWQEWSAIIAHKMIYATTAVVLLTGVLMMSEGVSVFNLVHFPALLTRPEHLVFFDVLHIWSCGALAALIVLHVGAVVQHHWAGRPIFKRMWW